MRTARSWIPGTLSILLLLPVMTSPVPAAAQEDPEDAPTVAVLDFAGFMMTDAGNSPHIGKAVSSMLATELSRRDGLQPIERSRLQGLLAEQGLSLSGRVQAETAAEIGQMLGAGYVISGQATSIGGDLRLGVRLIDVESSEVLETLRLTDEPDELLSLVVRVADGLRDQLDLTAASDHPEVEAIPVPATIEFSRGLDDEDQGRIESAVEHYQRALQIHPGHRDAQRALERLTGGRDDSGGR